MVSRSEYIYIYIYILSWISGGFSRSMFQEAPHHRAGRAYELHRYGDVGRLGPRFGPIQRWHHRSLAELGGRTWGEVWNQHQPDINQQFVHGEVNVSALGELEPCRFFLIRAIGHLPMPASSWTKSATRFGRWKVASWQRGPSGTSPSEADAADATQCETPAGFRCVGNFAEATSSSMQSTIFYH